MSDLHRLVAAHPLCSKPYNAIKFARVDRHGTPLYRVTGVPGEIGASTALKAAFEKYGAHCFHCEKWMPPQILSQQCTRDHLRAKKDGGKDQLHNLVFSCGPCNRKKGCAELISFQVESGEKYLRALVAHLERCMDKVVADKHVAVVSVTSAQAAAG